jgi:hypothetical protein
MTGEGMNGVLRRWLADFVLALALFWAGVGGVSMVHTHAHALPRAALGKGAVVSPVTVQAPAVQANARQAEPDQTLDAWRKSQAEPPHALLLLSLALAAIAASNLAVCRHLRRAYASPRRGTWRRG